MTNIEIKIGDIVKLRDYSCFEYPKYKGQKAKVVGTVNWDSDFDWEIEWLDGETSYASKTNMIKVSKPGRPPKVKLTKEAEYLIDAPNQPLLKYQTKRQVLTFVKECDNPARISIYKVSEVLVPIITKKVTLRRK